MSVDPIGLTCEWHLDGEIVRGDVRDLSHTGFFIETTARIDPGLELELRLVGGAAPRPIYLRGVVDPGLGPGERGRGRQHGVQIRLLCLSREYSRLISGEHAVAEASTSPQTWGRPAVREGDAEWLSEMLESEEGTPLRDRQPELERVEWEAYEPLSERAGTPLFSDGALVPEAVVIDDGELDDVVGLLAEIGVKAQRQSPAGASFLASWTRPKHLLVISAKRALNLRLPLRTERQGFVSIVVADSDARTLCAAVRGLGYHYIISRPIHPLAMAMLFRQAIYPDHENRAFPREVLGFTVEWWCAWIRKQSGLILDLSVSGCQLLVRGEVVVDSRIKIRVPGRIANVRDFTLAGRIIRSNRHGSGRSLGISFEEPSARVRDRLQQILGLPGPCRLTEEPLLLEGRSSAPAQTAGDERRFRREKVRASVRMEVVALDRDLDEIKHVLVSSDLAVDGMRVEPHPSLVIGEQLTLVLYEGSHTEPLRIAAEVARDDGRSGWWLRFVGVTPEVHDRLTGALDRFPPVSRLDDTEPEPASEGESGLAVLGRVRLRRKRRKED